MAETRYWGIDLGGSKIEGVVVASLKDPQPLCRLRVRTEAKKGYTHVLGQIGVLLSLMEEKVGSKCKQIGIATPGSIDPKTNLLRNSNTTCFNGKALQRDLEDSLGVGISLANDAECFALAETYYGAARGAGVVFGAIIGTGVGGGIVIDRAALSGCQGIAGEWGHNLLEPEGVLCFCGRKGCVETVISGPALENFYMKHSGERKSLEVIDEIHKKGRDEHARATIDRLSKNFAKAIGVVINILDPDVIVLGGGVSNVESLYTEAVAELKQYVFNSRVETKIVRNMLGDSAGVFGAAMLSAA